MLIKVTRNNLYYAVVNLSMAINPKPALPVMSTIKFSSEDGRIIMQSTDSEVSMKKELEVIETEGELKSFCMDAVRMKNALANIPEQPIVLDVKENELKCRYSGGSFRIPLKPEDPEAFPAFPESDKVSIASEMDIQKFCKYASMTLPFLSTDELRPQMRGMCMCFTDSNTELVGTDGHSLVKIELPFTANDKGTIVISRKVISIVSRIFSKTGGKMNFWVTPTNVFINCGDTTICGRLVEGRYPNYNSVIPSGQTIFASFDVTDMLSAIRRVSVMAGYLGHVSLETETNSVNVESSDLDFNTSADEQVKAECSGHLKMGYKADLLENVLSLLTGTARMELVDATHACKFSESDDGCTLTAIVMPVLI